MIHAIFFGLDVAVQHGAVGFQPKLVRRSCHVQPLAAVDFVIADDAPHSLVEDFRAAARQRIHAGIDQLGKRLANRKLAALRQIGDLHHGERLQVNLGEALLQPAKHVAIPIQRQLRMQAADNMELGDRFAPTLARAMPHFVERPGVSLGILGALSEGAQLATRHADIGGIDVPVDVKPGDVAVFALAHQVGHIADGENIVALEKRDAVRGIQANIGLYLFQNRPQPPVFKMNLHGSGLAEEDVRSPKQKE